MCTKRNLLTVILAVAIMLLTAPLVRSATPAQIETAIDNGINWLVTNQNGNGSWGTWYEVGVTGLAVVKLQDRARELSTSEYDDEIEDGLNYIFNNAHLNLYGAEEVTFTPFAFDHDIYQTGIAAMAIANDGDLTQIVAVGPLTGMDYEEVLNRVVNYFLFGQNPNGGWGYNGPPGAWSDQSNTGYSVLGLSYMDNAGITIPASIGTGLDTWIDYIQSADGGSGYSGPGDWENVLKTGNLLFQMSYRGMGPGNPDFDAAIDYIETHWQDGNPDPGWGYGMQPHYQATYCLMKGLQSSGVDLIDTDGDAALEDWFNQEPPAVPAQDFASAIVATQLGDGSWPLDYWGDTPLSTAWALLTLEKVTVVHSPEVMIDIKPGSCPNPFNGKSEGSVPVAIIGTEDLDVTTINLASLRLNNVPIIPDNVLFADVTEPLDEDPEGCSDCFNEEDHYTLDTDGDGIPDTYEGDGYEDLVVKFDTQALAAAIGPEDRDACVKLTLTGEMDSGVTFEASDFMVIRTKIK